jgi:hypothetical protein
VPPAAGRCGGRADRDVRAGAGRGVAGRDEQERQAQGAEDEAERRADVAGDERRPER